ncbi:hypothetical protein TNCV_2730841 [Trichonephila clavipes]|nr:hypothetical protein TNCV_2730841 [Trichonephila clavipes]
MENHICNSMILTSRRRHFYLVGQSKHKVGACGVNNQASAVLAGNELPFVAFSPDGRGYELVSSVRALVPQKFSFEEELMHDKHVDVKSPHVGVMWKIGRGVISSVIENATFHGNCRRLKLSGKLLGMIGMCGIRKLSLLSSPVKTVAFIKCFPSSVIRNRVPLHILVASKFHINKTGTPTFNSKLCNGRSNDFKELRNSQTYLEADLYSMKGICSSNLKSVRLII